MSALQREQGLEQRVGIGLVARGGADEADELRADLEAPVYRRAMPHRVDDQPNAADLYLQKEVAADRQRLGAEETDAVRRAVRQFDGLESRVVLRAVRHD